MAFSIATTTSVVPSSYLSPDFFLEGHETVAKSRSPSEDIFVTKLLMSNDAPKRLVNWGRERDRKRSEASRDANEKQNSDPDLTFAPTLIAKQPVEFQVRAVNQAPHQRLFDIAEEQRKCLQKQQHDEHQRIRQAELRSCTFRPVLKTRNSTWYREATSFKESFFSSKSQKEREYDCESISTARSDTRFSKSFQRR